MNAERSRVRPAGWWFDGLLVVAFVVLTYVLWHRHLLGVDLAVRDWADGHRPWPLHWLARAGNELGQGGFFTLVALLIAGYIGWKRHSVRPVLPVLMAFALTFVSITSLKDWTDRAAPHANTDKIPVIHPERFGSGGISYPSGHLANALVWYGTLALLLSVWLPRRWLRVIRIAPPVVLSITTVYLGYHWLSDTVAGVLLGLFLWRLIARVPWDTMPLGRWISRRGWDRSVFSRWDADVLGEPPVTGERLQPDATADH
jgi:membrane-associated phospholipid phosphatase